MNFSSAPKYFIVRCSLFIPTMKHPKVTRLASDCAQVLEWVLRNNCNHYSVFFLTFLDNFDYPKICTFFEVVEIEVLSNKLFQISLPQK